MPSLTRAGASLVMRSENAKTGDMHITYAAMNTCPDTCPLGVSGTCYAMSGPISLYARKLAAEAEAGAPCDTIANVVHLIEQLIARIEAGKTPARPLRLFGFGDLHCQDCANKLASVCDSYRTRTGAMVWGYTHHWRTVDGPIRHYVLASVESSAGAKKARARGYVPARVFAELPDGQKPFSEDGLTYVPCPEQMGRIASCADCQLCAKTDLLRNRNMAIAFAAHGTRARVLKGMLG